VPDWLERNSAGLARCRRLLADMEAAPAPDVAMLSVVVRSLSELGRTR
jgi:NAD-specific glutamate dehydrogenase